jgi:hypothetical protein
LRELVCAAEEAAADGLPSPVTTPTGGVRLEPARHVSDLIELYPHLARAQASSQDLGEWRAMAAGHESSTDSSDDDCCSSPPARFASKADGIAATPLSKSLSALLSPAPPEDHENFGRSGRHVQFSSSSPRVQLIPACAGAIRRPGKRSHRRRHMSTASLAAMQASFAHAPTPGLVLS